MSINLSKNSTISLTKEVPSLSQITVGLGWDVAKPKGFFGSIFGSGSIDLDASCILMDENQKVIDEVWFSKLKSSCKGVHHQGDNRTGEGDGDDEQIRISLSKLNKSVKYIAITVNSFTGQSFEKVDNSFCRIIDQSSKEVCRFTLSEQGNHTGIFIGLLSLKNKEWSFSSKGIPMSGKTVKDMANLLPAHI
ncbi:TerD family protein [Enterovibrio makurazakiensis]|uniref:TerD family protein n=1 Tax=Enterovibrio gelatinilyticus TaxID=2899819 RepID=A0ABT5QWD4_9GAMM|nr:TerD family protein [Enterovibrio sp. ZSDZ42]MDD1792309.1 TerD family protein [Enterovibrio sp. ZSDZ42]